MVTLDMIRKPVEGDLEAFEQFIRQKFTADGTLLSEMLDYALSARGKGIRPMTVLLEGLQITLDRLADHIECYHNRTFVYVEKRLAEYRAIVSPPEYNRPEPGINPCKGSDFSLSRGGNSMFFRTFGNRQKHSR
jgi:hypothetical protein